MPERQTDYIARETARTLHGLFRERIRHSPDAVGYTHFDPERRAWRDFTWQEMGAWVNRCQHALRRENLQKGDRVGILLRNCPSWVAFEQAALGLGLVVVPLYTNDRAENIGYIIENAGIRILLFQDAAHWQLLSEIYPRLDKVQTLLSIEAVPDTHDMRVKRFADWLPETDDPLDLPALEPDDLATIVYTSGTTGNPKGVMLSHDNILWNATAAASCETFYTNDVFLSFLPLSHMFERTAGYYMPMVVGARIAYARSVEQLAEDMQIIRPTVLITVPRIFERVYNRIDEQLAHKPPLARKLFELTVTVGWHRFEHAQGRAPWSPKLLLWPLLDRLVARKVRERFGGRLRLAVSGGAPLSPEIARVFIGLGFTISQGYGMTELSPVVCTNRLQDNRPETVGQPLPGVEVKLGENDELLVRSPGVMLGYWKMPEATAETIDEAGWLHTGDVAKIEDDHIIITGRLKEIIVLATGEKVPPADMELAISADPLFEQVMVVGEGKPFLSALVVLNEEHWRRLAEELGLSPEPANLEHPDVEKALLERINRRLARFPGYARIVRVHARLEPWTIEAGFITPTLKLKRKPLHAEYEAIIDQLYKGH